jgi:hypothetical protein
VLTASAVVALDRISPFPSPPSVIDPQRVADDVVVSMDRFDQGDVEEFASGFFAVAASSKPFLILTPNEQPASFRRRCSIPPATSLALTR